VFEFDARGGCSELPVALVIGIAVLLPGGDFLDQGLLVGNPAVETLVPGIRAE
jgi:hypothetical protein